jgi:protocatechuate 3,4-dioxygenase beta subunit
MLLGEDYFITSKNIDEYAASMPGKANTADYILDADLLTYPTENEQAAYLIFRAKDKDNGYEFGITDNGGDANFAFFNKTGGKRSQIGPSCSINPLRQSLWNYSDGFHIRIAVRGNTFSAFIDNRDILTVTDTSTAYAAPGKVGAENKNIVSYDNITVKPAGPKPWIVRGRVIDQNSKPIPGIDIRAYADPLSKEVEQDSQEHYTRTASDGSFSFIFDPAFPIDVGIMTMQTDLMEAEDDNIASKRVYSDAYVSDIRLSESTPEKNLDIKLLPTGSITGRIVDAKGRPIKNAYVAGISLGLPNNWSIVKSDNNGVFVMPGLSAPDNKYYVRIAAKGFSMKTVRTPFTVLPEKTTKIADIVLDPAARITGKVVNSKGKPVANITVSSGAPGADPWNYEEDDSIRSAKTNSKGVYLIEDIDAPGEYDVMVSKEYDILAEKTVKVKPGQLLTGINFKIK